MTAAPNVKEGMVKSLIGSAILDVVKASGASAQPPTGVVLVIGKINMAISLRFVSSIYVSHLRFVHELMICLGEHVLAVNV